MTERLDKILVYCPMSPKTEPDNPLQVRVFGRSLQSIMRLEHHGELTLVFEAEDHPKINNSYKHIVWRYNKARQMALDGEYDALFTVESDIVLPQDTLPKLEQLVTYHGADVAYGLYVNRHGLRRWLVTDVHRMGYAEFLSDNIEKAKRVFGHPYTSVGVGMGCTLITRPVFEKIDFRIMSGPGMGHGNANDWYFAIDLQEHGFHQMHHLGVVCGHITVKPAPMILWPDPEADGLYSIEPMEGLKIEPVKAGNKIYINTDGGEQLLSLAEARVVGIPIVGEED